MRSDELVDDAEGEGGEAFAAAMGVGECENVLVKVGSEELC